MARHKSFHLVDRFPPWSEASDSRTRAEIHVSAAVDHVPANHESQIRDVKDAGIGAIAVSDFDDHNIMSFKP